MQADSDRDPMDAQVLARLQALEPTTWRNPRRQAGSAALKDQPATRADLDRAAAQWERWTPMLRRLIPDLPPRGIESTLTPVPNLQRAMGERLDRPVTGTWLVKGDHDLPLAGSIKARGGFYAVLDHAEKLAREQGLGSDALDGPAARQLFARHRLTVGSTGNLGLSIGLMGKALGFRVDVHMSTDAKAWKKRVLRGAGANVVEHRGDFTAAVAEARQQSAGLERCFFIDDEHSRELFLGYAVAATRLGAQLRAALPDMDLEHGVTVHLPCGVGGGPSGIAFGLWHVFGETVRCWFVEPTHAPCMMLGLLSGEYEQANVHRWGIDGMTTADGLAVAAPSGLAARSLERTAVGGYTVSDPEMLDLLRLMHATEGMRIEPSAAASLAWPMRLPSDDQQATAVHISWLTGGSRIPADEFEAYLRPTAMPGDGA